MAAAATATGTLETTPMSQLLVYALDKRLTGSFVFQTHDGKRSALYVQQGAPLKAKTADPVAYLGRVLLELGKIDEATYNASLARIAKERRLHGQLLLEQGSIDQAALDQALAEQLERQVVWLFSLPSRAAYGFYEGQNYLERWGAEGARVEPLSLFWRGVRAHELIKRIDVTLARLGPHPVRLHPQAQLGRFRFAPADMPVLDVIRAKPQLLRDLLGCGVAEVPLIKRIVYALMLSRHMDLGLEPLGISLPPVGGAPEPPPHQAPLMGAMAAAAGAARPPPLRAPPPLKAPPPLRAPGEATQSAPAAQRPRTPETSAIVPTNESPEVAEFRRELKSRLETVRTQNYYEILGVSPKTEGSAISAAFFQLAKKWHPDRLGPEYLHVRDDAMTLFSRMTEAHQVLSDADKRREYDEVVKQGGGTAVEQEEVQKVMRAVVAYQKAQVFFQKQNYAEAEKLAKQAMDEDPEQQEYVALWVRIEAQKPERAAKNRFDDLIRMMDEAVKKERDNDKVRFARGEVLKRAGKLELAVKDFKWVAQHNPRNLEATREVRLYTMRGGSSEAEKSDKKSAGKDAEKGGMLGKLFKR